MAITAAQREALIELYVAIPGRAPDASGLSFWAGKLESGTSLTNIAQAMWDSADAQALYPNSLTVEETVTAIYENVLGRSPDAAGLAFWVGRWNANGANGEGKTLLEMINAINNYSGTDAAALASKALFEAKVAFGEWFAIDFASNDLALAQAGFDVLQNGGTVADAQAFVQTDPAESKVLTAGQDLFTTGSGDDSFLATQSTIQTGDNLNGGAGDDTLTISASSGFFATPTLNSIDKVVINGPSSSGNLILDLSNSDGQNELESFQTTGASSVQFRDIQNVNGTDIRIIDTDSVDHHFTYDVNAYLPGAGNDVIDLYLEEVGMRNYDGPVVSFGNTGAALGTGNSNVDQINIVSEQRDQITDTTQNYLWDLRVGSNLTTVNISGSADLEVEDFLDSNVTMVNASGLNANLWLDLYGQGFALTSGVDTTLTGLTVVGAQGNDDIDVYGNGHGNYSLGNGNDDLTITAGEDYAWGHNTIATGAGNDAVWVEARGLQGVDLGAGHDDLTILGDVDNLATLAAFDGVSTITAGDGNDDVYIAGYYDAYSKGAYSIDLGAGDDFLNMWVDGNPTVTAGAGNDTAIINVLSDVTFFGNDGNDSLTINGDGVHTIDMGNGNDIVDINGDNVSGPGDFVDYGADTVTVISTGAGNDTVDVSHNHYLDVTLGTGDDQITLRAKDLTADDIVRGDQADDTQVGSDTMILTNTDGEWVVIGDSETSSTVGIETFDLRNQNIRINLTEQMFDTATNDDITVSTRKANGVALPVLFSAAGVQAAEQFDQGMSREEYETIREKMADGDYFGIPAGTDVEDYLLDSGVNIIDFVDDDLSGDDDQISGYGEDPVSSDDESEDSVFFQLEPGGEMIIDITDAPLTLLNGRNFTLDGGNIKDTVIANDATINGRATLRFDDSSANNSIQDTLIVEGAASISAADLREVVGLENIILKSDANSAQTWNIELTDRVINQTTGSATLYIKVDAEVPAGSRLNITLDDSIVNSTNDVVIEANSNVAVYINGSLVTESDMINGTDFNSGPNMITVQEALMFTTNADSLIGSGNFYVQSVNQLQEADSAEGLGEDDTLHVGFVPSNPTQDLEDQFNDALITGIEHVVFTTNDFTGLTGGNVQMERLSVGEDFLDNLQSLTTGVGDDFLDDMEGENYYGGTIRYYLNAGNDYFNGEDSDHFWVDAGAGNDTVYLDYNADDSTVYGGDGNDSITTGEGEDYIEGGAGNDTISSRGGEDEIYGGSGDDSIYAGEDDDYVDAGTGNDTVYAGSGSDTVIGGAGNDLIYGGEDNDSLSGGTGNDTIYGGEDNDYIEGNDGNDSLYGEDGSDTIHGGEGNDWIDAGWGTASEHLTGGAGNDTILMEYLSRLDTVDGGTGTDHLIIDRGPGIHPYATPVNFLGAAVPAFGLTDQDFVNVSGIEELTVDGYYGGNAIWLDAGAEFQEAGIMTVNSGASSDVLDFSDITSTRNLTIHANSGDDTVVGGNGSDTINAGSGADEVYSSTGADDIDLGVDSDVDSVFYSESFHGALTGVGTGADQITNFNTADDMLEIIGNLFSAIDANASTDIDVAANNNAVDASTEEMVIDTSQAVTDADLTTNGFANLLSHLNNGLQTAGAGDNLLYLVQGQNDTALYFYQEDTGNGNIEANEIRLIGVFENALLDGSNVGNLAP